MSIPFFHNAAACEYGPIGSPKEVIENSELIFHGIITSAKYVETTGDETSYPAILGNYSVAEIRVEHALKGTKENEVITVNFPTVGTTCGPYPDVGRADIFFLKKHEGSYFYDAGVQEDFRNKVEEYNILLKPLADEKLNWYFENFEAVR
jgi:hypothetical protein